jgi:hypothetical protein
MSRFATGRTCATSGGQRSIAIDGMLLNSRDSQASISELKSTVAQQQKGLAVLATQLKEQAAELQRVSDQIETNEPHRKWCLMHKPAMEETAMLVGIAFILEFLHLKPYSKFNLSRKVLCRS